MSTTLTPSEATLHDLLGSLRDQGIGVPDAEWMHAVPLQRLGAQLAADDPALALAEPLDWLQAQVARGPGHALVLGLVGYGLRSRLLRCHVATPGLVLAVETRCPLLGDDVEQGRMAVEAVVQLAGRAVRAAAGRSGPRVAALISDRQGSAVAAAADWTGVGGPLPPDPLAWLELLQRLEA